MNWIEMSREKKNTKKNKTVVERINTTNTVSLL